MRLLTFSGTGNRTVSVHKSSFSFMASFRAHEIHSELNGPSLTIFFVFGVTFRDDQSLSSKRLPEESFRCFGRFWCNWGLPDFGKELTIFIGKKRESIGLRTLIRDSMERDSIVW
jgi:hypothetical protein